MALAEVLRSVKGQIVLNNGISSEGVLKTVNESLGAALDPSAWDNQKAFNIYGVAQLMFDKAPVELRSVKTSAIVEE